MRHTTANPPSLIEGLFFKRLTTGVISEFETLGEANPAKIPIGPANVIDDNIGFHRGGGTSL